MQANILYDLSIVCPKHGIKGKYKSLDYHRNGNPGKAQWTITVDEEIDCFANTKKSSWIDAKKAHGWGIIANGNGHKFIGYVRNKGENIEVYIARFVGIRLKDEWHGYPANVARCSNDKPKDQVLKEWLSLNYISKSDFTRIRRGIL